MTSQEQAQVTYLRITSHAPYSEMNGIPRGWFEDKIAEALDEYARDQSIAYAHWLFKRMYPILDDTPPEIAKKHTQSSRKKKIHHQ